MVKLKTKSGIRTSPYNEDTFNSHFEPASQWSAALADDMYRAKGSGVNPIEVSRLLDILKQIRLYSLHEIKGKFAPEEWMYLADALKGRIVTPEFRTNSSGLVARVQEIDSSDGLGFRWDVEVPIFVQLIKSLTGAQVDAVYAEVERFWNNAGRLSLVDWTESL